MTALSDFARLEAAGIWRETEGAQRRDVIVSLGEASLTIFDMKDTALTHWSLAAVERLNPRESPALYSPGPESGEELELSDDTIIDAIERVRSAVARRRPRSGRLRLAIMGGALALVLALGVFWLPDALIRHTASVVPPVARAAIGARLLSEIEKLTGPACVSAGGQVALSHLAERLFDTGNLRLVVLPDGLTGTAHLPGRTILLGRGLVEDHEDAEPAAGYLLAEVARIRALDPLLQLLRSAGPRAAFRLLTTGRLDDRTYRDHAAALIRAPRPPVGAAVLLPMFRAADLSSRPYAMARDISGETVLPLIEGDPFPQGTPRPVLSDGDWLRLQAICGE